MPYLTNEELKKIEEVVKEIKMKENVSDFTTLKSICKMARKYYSADVQEIEYVNKRALGLLCVNNGEITIILNKNSIYDFDRCYTILYLLGYAIMKEEDTYIYLYTEYSDILGKLESQASYFAELMLDF